MGGSFHMNAAVLRETFVGFLKGVVSQLFPKYSKTYVNLNVKSSPKLNGFLKTEESF